MLKDGRYINAGQNEFYRWGGKAVSKIEKCLTPNENGYYSIQTDGEKYYTIGTSFGQYGEYAKFGNVCFSVNNGGFAYAKVGTEKGDAFVNMLNTLIRNMNERHWGNDDLIDEEL